MQLGMSTSKAKGEAKIASVETAATQKMEVCTSPCVPSPCLGHSLSIFRVGLLFCLSDR